LSPLRGTEGSNPSLSATGPFPRTVPRCRHDLALSGIALPTTTPQETFLAYRLLSDRGTEFQQNPLSPVPEG